ncbi:heat shock protein 70 [Phytophthora cinnamomi]|uniref:heat shock protein 70 n=1 Tax=Phytophthora cinnamomi TaxID=4785 RepID=UPI0035596111|nr:heat shock protein 70 [Phytophthora cinnamomi]
MRGIVETYTGKEANSAVVTVPAYFNYPQRQAVKDAGAIAGLNVLRMISSSTAASMAHGVDKKGPERKVLVVDLGASTMDMSVVAFEECNFEVLGTAGDINLGGDDFDNRLVGHCVDEFKKAHGKDLRTDSRAMPRLRKACERAKRALSLSKETTIELEALHDGINFLQAITRTQFESLCADLFD